MGYSGFLMVSGQALSPGLREEPGRFVVLVGEISRGEEDLLLRELPDEFAGDAGVELLKHH